MPTISKPAYSGVTAGAEGRSPAAARRRTSSAASRSIGSGMRPSRGSVAVTAAGSGRRRPGAGLDRRRGSGWRPAGSATTASAPGCVPELASGFRAPRAAKRVRSQVSGRSSGSHPGGRRVGRVVGEQEVLALRERAVVRRHVDASQVAVALEHDPHHVVHLALVEHRAFPQAGDGRDVRIGPVDGGADAQPGRMAGRVEVVDDLEPLAHAVVDRGGIGEDRRSRAPDRRAGRWSTSTLRAPSIVISTVSSSVHSRGRGVGEALQRAAAPGRPPWPGAVSARLLPSLTRCGPRST